MEMQSQDVKDLVTALAKAQASIKPAKKDTDNPFFKSKYADLASVHEACMTHLTANGLSVAQTLDNVEGKTVLVTTLFHSSGQWLKSVAPIIPTKQDSQGIGSAITYMRRYSLAALVGVSQEDDDGNAASGNDFPKQSKTREEADLGKKLSMALDREQADQIYDQALKKLNGATDLITLQTIWKGYEKTLKSLPHDLQVDLIQKKDECKADLSKLNGHESHHNLGA